MSSQMKDGSSQLFRNSILFPIIDTCTASQLTNNNSSNIIPSCLLHNSIIFTKQYILIQLLPLAVIVVILVIIALLWLKRKQTYRKLVQCGLPTIYWRPKFVKYDISETQQKLASSTITNILPRMKRLHGPYGMYGTVYGVSTAVIHVAHPIPATALLQGVTKAPAYNHFKNFCGDGVFTADGDDWKGKRSAVLHALMRGKAYQERLEQEIDNAGDNLIDTLGKHSNSVQNIVPILQQATIGLIFRYITHQDINTALDDKQYTVQTEKSMHNKEVESKNITLLSSYLDSITKIRMIILAQSRSIWFLLPRWVYTYFSSLYKAEEDTMGPIRRVAEKACTVAQPTSPLHQLLNHNIYSNKSSSSSSNNNNNNVEEIFSKNIIDEAITLLFAGQDTSAATLSWTLHLLSLYPNVQTKLAKEVTQVLHEAGGQEKISKKLFSKMTYLDAVIKESMRLYPVAPFVVRKVNNNIKIPTIDDVNVNKSTKGFLSLPNDALACIWIYSLHRHPDFWYKPNDFIPERWIEQSDIGIKTPGAYIPFASGPRNCVGQPLANIILRCLLSRLISKYEFHDDRVKDIITTAKKNNNTNNNINKDDIESLRIDMQAGFTVLPQGGLRLRVTYR